MNNYFQILQNNIHNLLHNGILKWTQSDQQANCVTNDQDGAFEIKQLNLCLNPDWPGRCQATKRVTLSDQLVQGTVYTLTAWISHGIYHVPHHLNVCQW